jgi:hypothetical protein
MIEKLSAAALALTFALLTPACTGQPPKQAEAPDVLSDKGSDMSTGEDSRNGATLKDTGPSGAEQMHDKCCGQCKDAMAKDRTGAAANTIPCTDFTDALDPFCLEHFRGKKTMASECR